MKNLQLDLVLKGPHGIIGGITLDANALLKQGAVQSSETLVKAFAAILKKLIEDHHANKAYDTSTGGNRPESRTTGPGESGHGNHDRGNAAASGRQSHDGASERRAEDEPDHLPRLGNSEGCAGLPDGNGV